MIELLPPQRAGFSSLSAAGFSVKNDECAFPRCERQLMVQADMLDKRLFNKDGKEAKDVRGSRPTSE